MKSGFEEYYSTKYPNDDCTLMRNGNYSGWLKQQLWEQWQHQQSKVDELTKQVDAAQKLFDDWNCGGMNLFDLLDALEQVLKGSLTPDLNTDENGECRHFSTAMFNDGKAECFHCDAIVNGKREVIGKQSKGLHPFFKEAQKN